jgi:hypothetical protein
MYPILFEMFGIEMSFSWYFGKSIFDMYYLYTKVMSNFELPWILVLNVVK